MALGTARPCAASDVEDAQKRYAEGVLAFDGAQYETALERFKEAFNLSGNPDILFNLAVCHEKLNSAERAIAFYELYLEEVPDAPDADAVRGRIAALKNPAPAPEATPPPPTAEPAPPPQEVPPSKADSRKDHAPSRTRIGQGLVIGIGALVLGSGITAIAATRRYNDYEAICAPVCSDAQAKKVRAAAIAADVQMGVGLAALTAGIIWILVDRSRRDRVVSGGAGPGGIFLAGRF